MWVSEEVQYSLPEVWNNKKLSNNNFKQKKSVANYTIQPKEVNCLAYLQHCCYLGTMPPNLNINGFPRNVKCCYLVPQKTTGGQYGSRKQWKTSTTIPYPPAPCKNSFDFCFFFSKEFLSPGCHLVYKTTLSTLIFNRFWSLKFKVSSRKII